MSPVVASVGEDRETEEAILQLRDRDGKLIAVRLKPQQFGMLTRGVLGLSNAHRRLEYE